MEGVEILNKTQIMETTAEDIVLGIVCIIACCAFYVLAWAPEWESFFIRIVFSGMTILFIILAASCFVAKEPTGRYRYEATIDKSVSMTDIHEKYKVIDQEGKIWTLEDKETD